ncbi:hypothetical protein PIB30_029433 [Stylosanthes scabra]|uniref:Glutaredoxin domain-containing protein n=1 Tax=Stylosanthes scabra TaxID=79078 RepID=A0ABU6X9M4_9FABA|nr:hypothetical protein [Stylosanthes scabra]
MGCVSSNLLNHDDDFTPSALGVGHHIVSLTSTTYGLLTLDPPSTTTTSSTVTTTNTSTISEPPDVINFWELMKGLEADESFRFSPLPLPPSKSKPKPSSFERICPPRGENRVVIYTTSLRGVRRTFEACCAVKAAFEAFGVSFCERDVSMDSGFKQELRDLLKGKEREETLPPRVFVKGFYVGGAEELLRAAEEGLLAELLQGVPRKKKVCEGCGDMRFLPCFRCNGSCKTAVLLKGTTVVIKCAHCNENGLVVCPVCM